jgi:uncharacterized protein
MTKKPVIRTCVVCRDKDQKRQLSRLVRTEEGVIIDSTGKLNGRGAYLCDNPECWVRAASSDILSKALRVTLTEADRERIRQAASAS